MSNERLAWKQIQEKYPNQWVGLVDIEYEPDNDATIAPLPRASHTSTAHKW